MKTPLHSRHTSWRKTLVLPSAAAALLLATPAGAANYYWDPSTGNSKIDAGSGTWDLNTGNITWSDVPTGATNTYWTNTSGLVAYFGPTSAPVGNYAVSVGSGIQTQSLTFNASGYLLTAAAPTTLTLGFGGAATITVNTGVTATIGDNLTVVAGTTGGQPLTLSGTGTVVVGANSAGTAATLKAGGNNNVNLQSGVTVRVAENGYLQGGVAATGTGTIVVGSSGTNNATLTVDGGTVNNFLNLVIGNVATSGVSTVNLNSGTISTAGATGIVRLGTSSATVSGTGVLNLNGGTLNIGGIAVGAAGSAVYNINFNGGVLKAAQSSTTFFASSSQINASVLTNGAVIDTNGNNITVSQKLVSGITNDGGLTKQGLGILTLAGSNSYTGATTVKEGSLALGTNGVISDSIVLGSAGGTTGTLDVTLKGAGANYTLGKISGNGIVATNAGTVTANGIVSPGFSTGVLDIKGNLTLAGSALVQMEIASSGSQIGIDLDNITVEGALTYGGTLTVSGYNGYDFAQAGTYDLFDFTSKSGDFSSVTVSNVSLVKTGEIWKDASSQYSFDQTSGVLSVYMVPEPSTYAMLVGGIGILGLLRRKLRA